MNQKITRKREKWPMKNKQTNQPKNHAKKNKEITAKLRDLLDLRVSVHGRGRNCCTCDLTGSALLDYSNVLHLESSF